MAPAISVQHCHCSQCRKALWAAVRNWRRHRPCGHQDRRQANVTSYHSSPSFPGAVLQDFAAATCSPMRESEKRLMYFSPGTRRGVHPGHPADKECHIYVGSKAEWEQIADDLPKYETPSPDES